MTRPSIDRARRLLRPMGLAATLLLTGCFSPVHLSTQFTPPSETWLANGAPLGDKAACRVHIDGVVDSRDNPDEIGMMGPRFIQATDMMAWFNSGIQLLKRDQRLAFVDNNAAIGLKIELVRAYVQTHNMAKSSAVLIKVHYAKGGTITDRTYRGSSEGIDWATSEGETQGALDRSLADALQKLDYDLVGICGA